MTTKLKVKRFRTRKPDPLPEPAEDGLFDTPAEDGLGQQPFATARGDDSLPTEIDSIRREGLTGRQLRMARHIAQRHNLPAAPDFDAVRLLRKAGIDPFRRSTVLELVSSDGEPTEPSRALAVQEDRALPHPVKPARLPAPDTRAETSHAADILRIQQDIARRRRRKMALLGARLAFFVLLPTILAGYYYYAVATPFFATKSEFVIQQAENPSSGALGGLLSGTQFATAQDSIAVQGYLQSREAMIRLDEDMGFRAHFSQPGIDPIQRLAADASVEAAYKLYARNVKIAYDPTEGIVKMEVIAADPALAAGFATALISYAEEQVDQLTQRMREDQMSGARSSYEEAEARMLEAQRRVVELQERFKVLSSEVELGLITTQLGTLETQLTTERLSLQQMQSNPSPNAARMEPVRRRIAALEAEAATVRARLTEDSANGLSLAKVQSELLVAQSDVATRQLMLAQSLQSLETARVEANRQTRYLSLSVKPIVPDAATYPRAFENTLVTMLIFAGIYLMISMTAAILREQVSA